MYRNSLQILLMVRKFYIIYDNSPGISIFHSKPEPAIQPAGGILKRTSIYYTGQPPHHAAGASSSVSKLWCTPSATQAAVSPLTPCNVDVAPARSQAASCTKKQVAWADEGNGV